MNQVVIPVSYMGSGSSAITDLLSEVHGYESANGNFEYVLLHCPNGLFDLEDKLLRGNNALRSDEALHSFYECMQTLYSCKHFGVADYKHRVGLQFLDDCKDFINTLIISKNPNGYWYFQENPNQIMLLKKAIAKLIHLISLKKIKFGPVLRYRETWLSYPCVLLFAVQKYGLTGVIVTYIFQAFAVVLVKEIIMRKQNYRELM